MSSIRNLLTASLTAAFVLVGAAARAETQHSIGIAQQNLALVQGRALNAAQSDLASKVRSFMDSAREAMRNADWLRARSLAQKAEVLSQELADSL